MPAFFQRATVASLIAMMSAWSFSAKAAWKNSGPLVLQGQGVIQVHTFQLDAKNIRAKLLDQNHETVLTGGVNRTTINFYVEKPGTYYVQVVTDGFEDLQIVPVIKYQPVYGTRSPGSFRGKQTL